jgi:hypothetical protein
MPLVRIEIIRGRSLAERKRPSMGCTMPLSRRSAYPTTIAPSG